MHVGSIQFRMCGVLAIGTVCALIACSGGGGAPAANPPAPTVATMAMSPSTLNLNANDQAQFTATLSGAASGQSGVVWSALRGTISSTGLYTAPATAGSDTVTATGAQLPGTFASAAVTVAAGGGPALPDAPVLTGPTELQASGAYLASVALGTGLSAQWTLAGGTIVSGANSGTVRFNAGAGPYLTLTCKVTNSAGSASASRWMVVLPFAPRNYLADLKASLASNAGAIAGEVASGDPAVYYATSYYLNGLAAGAEATGDTQVMDALVGYATQMIALAQPLVRNGVAYPEWGPWDGNGNPQQLNTFQGASALARTAAVIAGNPVFQARYSAQFGQIVAFVDQSIFQYWFDKHTGVYADPTSSYLGGAVPWLPSGLGGWGEYHVWVDKCSLFGMTSAWMYQATRNPLYQEYAASGPTSRWWTDAGSGMTAPSRPPGIPTTWTARRTPPTPTGSP